MRSFERQIDAVDPDALLAIAVEVLQVNVGLRCNMSCTHCHQSCSPTRTEVMSDEVIEATLRVAGWLRPTLVDITGGAPELHPRIREIAAGLRRADLPVQLRTNLTVLLEPGCEDLPARWADLGIRLLASLPSWNAEVAARQRGDDAFASSIEVLRRLNAIGYGTTSELRLDLASNPDGARLLQPASELEQRFRRTLLEQHGVRFDALRVLTNMPLGRFGAQLRATGTLRAYHDMLRAAFNPAAALRLACRSSLVVAWDGVLYDCDFNLSACLPLRGARRTIFDVDGARDCGDSEGNRKETDALATRRIAFGPHCFACTAGAGSS